MRGSLSRRQRRSALWMVVVGFLALLLLVVGVESFLWHTATCRWNHILRVVAQNYYGQHNNEEPHSSGGCKTIKTKYQRTTCGSLLFDSNRNNNEDEKTKVQGSNTPILSNETVAILWSYYSRLLLKNATPSTTKTAKSFHYFLQNNQIVLDNKYECPSSTITTTTTEQQLHPALVEAMSKTCQRAIQRLASQNDYRTILTLTTSSLPQFVKNGEYLLDPRIYSQAILSLHQTSVNFSKIKKVWETLLDLQSSALSRPMDAYQTNAMLQVMASHNRTKQLLEVYRNHVVDTYSLSIVINALKDSIQIPTKPSENLPFQYVEAMNLLREKRIPQWNNPMVLAYLQLDQKVAQYCAVHSTAPLADALRDKMKRQSIRPDVRTCNQFLLNHDRKKALELFEEMKMNKEEYPDPNSYCYASIISRVDSSSVRRIMEQAGDHHKNTVVYNAAIHSLTSYRGKSRMERRSFRAKSRQRLRYALQWLEKMEESSSGASSPNTETYNAVLKVAATVSESDDWDAMKLEFPQYFESEECANEGFVRGMLKRIPHRGLQLNHDTYRLIFTSLANPTDAALKMLVKDVLSEGVSRNSILNEILAGILGHWSLRGTNPDMLLDILSLLGDRNLVVQENLLPRLIDTLCLSCLGDAVPVLLLSLTGDEEARNILTSRFRMKSVAFDKSIRLTPGIFMGSLFSCLKADDSKTANRVLVLMKQLRIPIDDETIEKIAAGYATAVLTPKPKSQGQRDPRTGRGQAESAMELWRRLGEPSPSLSVLVARACGSVGLFSHSQSILSHLHAEFEMKDSASGVPDAQWNYLLPSLQKYLIKQTAKFGDVNAAMLFVNRIRNFSDPDDNAFDLSGSSDRIKPFSSSFGKKVTKRRAFRMGISEWRGLIEAASKANKWEICLSSLQLLQPYVEESKRDASDSKVERATKDKIYGRLSQCLTLSAKCFEVRSQYAWSVRVINDWISWSARRPPKEAVLATFRVLSRRGRGTEIRNLLRSCMEPSLVTGNEVLDVSYGVTLSVGAITSLYNAGLYDSADDCFLDAVVRSDLPLALTNQVYEGEERITLDLHGMNLAVAHSAVRVTLQQEMASFDQGQGNWFDKDLVIVTGMGRGSALRLRPVLRPEIQRMLMEEFYPPLGSVSVPGNLGALRIPYDDVKGWVQHQQEQKSARMLAVASTIRSLTSGHRLRTALQRMADES